MKAEGRAVVLHAGDFVIGVESETEVGGFDVFLMIVRGRGHGHGRHDVGGCGVYLFGDPRLHGL